MPSCELPPGFEPVDREPRPQPGLFALTTKQVEATRLLGGPQRHSLLVGGSRSAKTFTLVRALMIRAIKSAGSRHVILRQRANAVRESIWLDTLPKVNRLCFPSLVLRPREQYGFVTLPNESEVWVAGLDDKERVEKILGKEFATMLFNECSQIGYASVAMALTRLAQKAEGIQNRAYYDLNPGGTGHWTYRQFFEGKSPESMERLSDPENYKHLYMNPADNRANIDAAYIHSLEQLPERQRRRFLDGVYVAEVDGALWSLDAINSCRVSLADVPEMRRVVTAVDPSGSSGQFDVNSDEIGIVTVGLGVDNHLYVLEDATGRYSPEQWGKLSVAQYRRHKADRIVGEANYGGDMVRAVIHASDHNVPYKPVTASRGKVVRAEPVAALYEQGKVHHVGAFPRMEDEMTNFSTAGYLGDRSPNRADALVWAITELALEQQHDGLIQFYRSEAKTMNKLQAPKDLIKPTVAEQTERCACGSACVQDLGNGVKRCGNCAAQWNVREAEKPLTKNPQRLAA